MYLLCLDEWLTGSASGSLCHDIDRALTAVYRRNKVEPRFAHWSMQWGLRTRHTWNAKYWSWWDQERSQSKYLDPHSVKIQANPLSETRPVDLLGLAASWSLSCYVLELFDKQKKFKKTDYATYLLCCSMWGFRNVVYQKHKEPLSKSLDLVANILNRGGNPNLYVGDFSTTIWGSFVQFAPWGTRDVREKLLLATKAFVENGADIHMTLREEVFIWKSPESQLPSGDESLRLGLSREMSILNWLHKRPDLEEILLAKGARNYSKYNHISITPQTKGFSKNSTTSGLQL